MTKKLNERIVIISVCAKAFSTEAPRRYDMLVSLGEHPCVRVWDSVAKHFTLCHALTAQDEARVVRAARKAVA